MSNFILQIPVGRRACHRTDVVDIRAAYLGLLLAMFLAGCAPSPGSKPDSIPRGAGALDTGSYRNLFVEAGRKPEEVNRRINAAFEQLFHGDPDSEAVYFPAGTNGNGPLAYILDAGSGDVRSEGMSYGMMIAVQLDRKAEFDALWNWARTHMYHSSADHPAHGYFAWSMTTNGTALDEMPAPDGEEYFVTALYFAAGRWGNGRGIYAYHSEADRLLLDLRHRQSITGPTVKGEMTAGALFDPDQRMVRFTPHIDHWKHTDPSYHLPAFYELWARCGPESERRFWMEAATASRAFLHQAAHPVTALTPDYANFDGTPWAAPWKPDSVHFQYDAWRTAMNWSMDWAWWAKDERQRELSDRLQAFFESRGIDTYASRLTLDGRALDQDHSTGLVAMNATASLAATHPRGRRFVEALWNTPPPTGEWRYYDGMLYLLGWLHCGGEFRCWTPEPKPPRS